MPRRWLSWLGLLLVLVLGGCAERREQPAPTDVSSAAPMAVPVPDGLVAELRLEQPAAAWSAARTAVGGVLATFPRSYGGLVVSMLGFPVGLVDELEEKRAVLMALGTASGLAPRVPKADTELEPADPGSADAGRREAEEPRALEWVVALPVRDPRRFLTRIRLEATDRLLVEPLPTGELVALRRTPKGSTRGKLPEAALAVAGRYLLVGSADDAVRRLGPYLAHTSAARNEPSFLPAGQRPEPPEQDPSSAPRLTLLARAAPLALRADALLGRALDALHKGDPGWLAVVLDPAEVRQVAAAAIGRADTVRARAELTDETLTLHLDVRLTEPLPQRWRPPLGVDVARVLEAPTDAVVVGAWVEPQADRLETAATTTKALLGWLGEPTPDVEPRAAGALRSVASGRGDWTAVGLRCTGVGLTGFATGPAVDERQLIRGLRALSELRRHPSTVKRLETAGLRVASRATRIPHWPAEVLGVRLQLDPSRSATVTPKVADHASPRPMASPSGATQAVARIDPVELLATVGAGRFVVAAGLEPAETIRALLEPAEREPIAARLRTAVGTNRSERTAFGLLAVDPLGLVPCVRGLADGDWTRRLVATLGAGSEPDAVWVDVEIGTGLLQALAR